MTGGLSPTRERHVTISCFSKTKKNSRQGHFFGFALYLDCSRDARPLPRGLTGHVAHPLRSILHRGLLGALLCAAALLANPFGVSLAHERPRRLVIGHVLLRGHARNGAADHVESQVLQRFEADATFTHVELLAALLVFAGEPRRESGMTVEAQEMQHHARLLRCERNK
jgi:hypothetical protein